MSTLQINWTKITLITHHNHLNVLIVYNHWFLLWKVDKSYGPLFYMLSATVFKVTTRTIPSAPGWISMIHTIFHCNGGRLSSLMMTKVPILRCRLWICCHLFLVINWCRYSLCHRFLKWWRNCWACCHADNRWGDVLLKSSCGKLVSGPLIRKWLGVKGDRSFGSDDIGDKGLDFKIASISITTVWSCSNVSNVYYY